MQKENFVNNVKSTLLVTLALHCLNIKAQNPEQILKKLQSHYNTCLSSNHIVPDNYFLASMIILLDDDPSESNDVLRRLEVFVDPNEWAYVSAELVKYNDTYWKPNTYCDTTALVQVDDYRSISRPIFYENLSKAAVIGYNLRKSTQTVIFLAKKEDDWEIVGDVNVGIYMKKSGK